jgi:hypothetical protein
VVVQLGRAEVRFGLEGSSNLSAAQAVATALLRARARESDSRFISLDLGAWDPGDGASTLNSSGRPEGASRSSGGLQAEEGAWWFVGEVALGGAEEVVVAEERLLGEGRLAATTRDGEGGRALEVDDRGAPLLAGAWPLVDHLLERGDGRVRFERLLDPERDAFLAQHRFNGVPLLPASFALELLAEAAVLTSPGWQIERALSAQFAAPVEGAPLAPLVRASARLLDASADSRLVEADLAVHAVLRGKPVESDPLRHRARFVLRRNMGAVPRVEIPAREGFVHARSFHHAVKEPLALGPTYTRAEWIVVRERSVTGTLRPARHRDLMRTTSFPRFRLDPLLVDGALQIAANWDGWRQGQVSLPIAVGQVSLGRPRAISEHARVHAAVVRADGADVFYDLLIAGDEGDLLMEIQGAHFHRVARVAGPDADELCLIPG